MSRRIANIFLCLSTGSVIVVFLYVVSGTPNTHKNGFKREIHDHYLTAWHSYDIDLMTYRFTGFTNKYVYFADVHHPQVVRIIDYDLSKTGDQDWVFVNPQLPSSATVHYDSPWIDIFLRLQNKILSARKYQEDSLKWSTGSVPGRQFDAGIRISDHSILIRTIDKDLRQYTLTKLRLPDTVVFEEKKVIEKQLDGFLSTDGMMFYDTTLSKFVYLYFYRNQFLILDSNLQLLQKARTIDTVSQAQIRIHNFKDGTLSTFDAPPLIVNRKACVWKGLLFIHSGLLADNEDRKMFSNHSIIDIYDLRTGKYLYSFYIPRAGKYKVDDFQVFDSLIISIQGHYIVSNLVNRH
jgi:hypothetical protein